jgi:hypothetical protein
MCLPTVVPRAFILAILLLVLPHVGQAGEVPHKLAVGATVVGAQVHWGFAKRWAVELRALKDETTSETSGEVTAYAYGVRGYRYFRRPSRLRFFMGVEAAATRSYSSLYEYETTGYAFGGFGGAEIYLLRRLSVGVDAGPYFLSSEVRRSNTSEGETAIVVNSFMNFYFL